MVPPLLAHRGSSPLLAYWLHRSSELAVFVVLALLLIINLGYWEATVETLSLVALRTLVCVVIGVPVGIAAAHRPWLYAALRPVLDLMQTMPTFVYLIPTLVLFGLGVGAGPDLDRDLRHPGADPPDPSRHLLGAAAADRGRRGLRRDAPPAPVQGRAALRPADIMAGVTQCIMLSLSMVVIAALVGADGLGKPVVRALNTVNIAMGFEAGLAIVILAIVLDRVCKRPERRCEALSMSTAVEFENVDIVFGHRRRARRWR